LPSPVWPRLLGIAPEEKSCECIRILWPDAKEKSYIMEEVILQIWKAASGQWAGRILRGDVEDGRVAGCTSIDDVEHQALEAGIVFDRIEKLGSMPPVQG